MADGERGEVYISSDPQDASIIKGFKLNYMNMRDASTGQVMWESPADWTSKFFVEELEAHVPKTLLNCKEVSREVNFSSVEKMDEFKLLQKVFFQGKCLEEWFFKFGFVMPDSTNQWQSTIEAAAEMLPAEILSGNVTIETNFFDGRRLLAKSLVRVFYD